jgi:hypothetical protein
MTKTITTTYQYIFKKVYKCGGKDRRTPSPFVPSTFLTLPKEERKSARVYPKKET